MTRPPLLLDSAEYTRGPRPGALFFSAALHVTVGVALCMVPVRTPVAVKSIESILRDQSITYVPSSTLPSVRSSEGAQSGISGIAGGRHSFRPTQAIRVNREERVLREVVDVPHLSLPVKDRALADLLAFAQPGHAKLGQQPIRVAAGASRRLPEAMPAPAVKVTNSNALPESLRKINSDPKLPVLAEGPLKVRAESPREVAADVAPPSVKANTSESGLPSRSYEAVVLSPMPGDSLGKRRDNQAGSTSMSFSGGSQAGIGKSGTGEGVESGNGQGAASTVALGPGAGATGSGHGSSETSKGGIANGPNGGGPGKSNGDVVISGVSIAGGATTAGGQIFIGSFGPTPSVKSQMPLGPRTAPSIIVTNTGRSGGVLQRYASGPRGKVNTIYVSTNIGTAVVEFTEAGGRQQVSDDELTAPEPLHASLPPELQNTPIVVGCLLDRSGRLQQVTVLERMSADLTQKLTAALAAWRFRPVLRGDEAIDVSMLVGLHVKFSTH